MKSSDPKNAQVPTLPLTTPNQSGVKTQPPGYSDRATTNPYPFSPSSSNDSRKPAQK